MDLSVIIVNYNVKFFLEQCLESLFQSFAPDEKAEVFVVDNASTDDSESYILSHIKDSRLHWIANKENVGFGRANNQAARLSTGKFLLFLNPDTIVTPEALHAARSCMRKDLSCGAIGMRLLNANGLFLPESKRGFPDPFTSFCKITRLYRLFPRWHRLNRYYLSWLSENEPQVVDILPGAFMYVRRTKKLEEETYFDERFFMYGEDIDLSVRIARTHKNIYIPEPILHYKGESTNHESAHYIKVFYEAMQLFQQKYYPRRRILNKIVGGAVGLISFLSLMRRKLFPVKEKDELINKVYVFCRRENVDSIKGKIPFHFLSPDCFFYCAKEILPMEISRCIEKGFHACLIFDVTLYSYSDILKMWVNEKFPATATFAFYSPSREAIVLPGESFH